VTAAVVYSRAVATRSAIVTNGVTLPADGGVSIYDPTSVAFADPA
jgi:hypothetical protein